MREGQESEEPRWLDVDEQQHWYAFAYVLTQLPAALETRMQREAGISHFDYVVLAALSMAPERTLRMSELAGYAGSTLSRLSNVVARLEKHDRVARRPDPDDGRSTLATLTDAGEATVELAAPVHVDTVRRLVFDPLTKAQQRQLGAVSQRMLTAMGAPCPTDRGPQGAPSTPSEH